MGTAMGQMFRRAFSVITSAQPRSFVLLALWAALVAFGIALSLAASLGSLLPGDLQLARELQERRGVNVLLTPLMVAVSVPGESPVGALLLIGVAGGLLLKRHWPAAVFIALTATGFILSTLLKAIVARPRPTPDLVQVYREITSMSFPSGHVVHYVVFFGAIGYLAWQRLRAAPAPEPFARAGLMAVLAVCAALMLLIGPSRVYLGAHWPTDVLGGYIVGSAWLLLLVVVDRRWVHRVSTEGDSPLQETRKT